MSRITRGWKTLPGKGQRAYILGFFTQLCHWSTKAAMRILHKWTWPCANKTLFAKTDGVGFGSWVSICQSFV